jgi:predicted alpha/beta hydrolase
MKSIKILTSDQYSIAATLFEPVVSNQKVLVIHAATGVPQRFYIKFSEHFAQHGYTVVTYDYRGIGASAAPNLRKLNTSYLDWADKDLRAVAEWTTKTYSNYRKIGIGHSFGGNCWGLTLAHRNFDAFVTVASQFGYWKNFNDRDRLKMRFLFRVTMPFLSNLLGYFPSKWFGLGENLPKQAALDWCVFINNEDSQLEYARRMGQNYYADITQPMLILGIADDEMAPKASVIALSERLYSNAQKTVRIIETRGMEKIGHLGFFREKNKAALWQYLETKLAEF